MVTLLLICSTYIVYFKSLGGSGRGSTAGSAVSTTGIELDLTALAQAERIYYLQNNSYGTVDQLISTGTMDKLRTGRDGYTYSMEPTETGFAITAKHVEAPASDGKASAAAPQHFSTLSMNEKMQLHRED
jgi:hypothetical protein